MQIKRYQGACHADRDTEKKKSCNRTLPTVPPVCPVCSIWFVVHQYSAVGYRVASSPFSAETHFFSGFLFLIKFSSVSKSTSIRTRALEHITSRTEKKQHIKDNCVLLLAKPDILCDGLIDKEVNSKKKKRSGTHVLGDYD